MKTAEFIQRAKEYLGFRQLAYQRTFNVANRDNAVVMTDLAKFCRAHGSAFHTDDRLAAVMEGRREVWLRIQHHLQLADDQLWKLYHKGE